MVEYELLQTASYLIAALSFAITCAYYIMNLRNTQKNMELTLETRRISLVRDLTKSMTDVDGLSSYIEQMGWEWKDYGDFEKKYGTENNVSAAAKRFAIWNNFNSTGAMLRKGVVGIEDLYDIGGNGVLFYWEKYKSVIEEGRRRYFGKENMKDFEYYAGEMLKYVREKDPSYTVPMTLDKYISDK
ncbi:DUF948 domain-containing protein [Candidatus Bathyarchaeota archaeon]|nr:DUF948 domain-containing protein [Candidatus Bathyarchaeota archaeon]